MFVFGNLIGAISRVLELLFTILWILILFRALVSWVNPDPYNPIVQFLQRTTEPILAPIRRAFRMQFWVIDISPIIAILLIYFLQSFLVPTLNRLSMILQ